MKKYGKTIDWKFWKNISTMDLILLISGVFLFVFTITMIVIFVLTGAEPDTLITCVFGAVAGEYGIMGWIKTTKDKYRDRKWMKEDEQDGNSNQADICDN